MSIVIYQLMSPLWNRNWQKGSAGLRPGHRGGHHSTCPNTTHTVCFMGKERNFSLR